MGAMGAEAPRNRGGRRGELRGANVTSEWSRARASADSVGTVFSERNALEAFITLNRLMRRSGMRRSVGKVRSMPSITRPGQSPSNISRGGWSGRMGELMVLLSMGAGGPLPPILPGMLAPDLSKSLASA